MSNAYLDSLERKSSRLLAANRWTKIFTEHGTKYRIKVEAELIHRDGNTKPYFSITAQIDRKAKNNHWYFMCGGCIHDRIVEHFPELQPLIDVHLSDDDGTPMHAYSNASYWAGHSKWQPLDLVTFARHLRVTETEAAELVEWVANAYGTDFDAVTTAENAWKVCCEEHDLPKRWAVEAAEALALLNIVGVV